MNKTKIFSLISDELTDKYAINDEKFNIFISKGFLNNQKFDEAIQQLQLSINGNSRPYITYLYLIAIYVETSHTENINHYVELLNKHKIPEEISQTLEKILGRSSVKKFEDIRRNTKFETFLDSLRKDDKNFIGWCSVVKGEKKFESLISIPSNFIEFIIFINQKILVNTDLSGVLGNISRLVYEFKKTKLFVVQTNERTIYLLGNEGFSINYILLKLNEEF